MIAFEFFFGEKRCITEWLNWENHKVGNGYEVDIIVDGEVWKNRGYLMIDEGNCYVDVCEDKEIDEFESVIKHCPIVATKMCGYDQAFVEEFHPNYNCNAIAWLDDFYCALHNEIDNHAHWPYLANDIVVTEWEVELCLLIYEFSVYGVNEESLVEMLSAHNFSDISDFGEYLALRYAREIQNDIDSFEGDIMKSAIDNFEYEMKIEEE